jgi:hypothetical protein
MIRLVCSAVKAADPAQCRNLRPLRIVGLDKTDRPVLKSLEFSPEIVKSGESAVFEIR